MVEEHLDLDGLRAELNRYPDGTPMDVLNGLLQRVQVSCEDVASSISFGDEEYAVSYTHLTLPTTWLV